MIGEAVGAREAHPPDRGGSGSGFGTPAMPPAVTVAERRQVRPVASHAVMSALQQAAGTEGPGRRDKRHLQSHSGRHRGEVASAAERRRLGGSWWLADALAEAGRMGEMVVKAWNDKHRLVSSDCHCMAIIIIIIFFVYRLDSSEQ